MLHIANNQHLFSEISLKPDADIRKWEVRDLDKFIKNIIKPKEKTGRENKDTKAQ